MPPSLSVNGIYKFKKSGSKPKQARPILPGDLGILREIEEQRELKRTQNQAELLEYLGPLKHYNPFPEPKRPPPPSDIHIIIECLLKSTWTDFPQKPDGNFKISPITVGNVSDFRRKFPKVITTNQMYGIYPRNTTHVDKCINEAKANGLIKVIQNHAVYSSDIIVESSYFYALLEEAGHQNFVDVCTQSKGSMWFDVKKLEQTVDINSLVQDGFLTRDTGNPGILYLSFPSLGAFQKLLRLARTTLLNIITQTNKKFREMPESQLRDKFENSKKFWTTLNGVKIEWVLYDLIGGGYIDGFSTPVGRGWKMLKS